MLFFHKYNKIKMQQLVRKNCHLKWSKYCVEAIQEHSSMLPVCMEVYCLKVCYDMLTTTQEDNER